MKHYIGEKGRRTTINSSISEKPSHVDRDRLRSISLWRSSMSLLELIPNSEVERKMRALF